MTIEQTIIIPDDRRVFLEFLAPKEISAGRVRVTVTIDSAQGEQSNTFVRQPISQFFGILSLNTYGDAVVYQRELRDEWND